MNRESAQLALAGALIGVLALSATAAAALHPSPQTPPTERLALSGEPFPGTTPARTEPEEALPVLATADPAADCAPDPNAGPFQIAFRVPDPVPGEKLFVCDALGCPLAAIEPDADGDAVLGPYPPGRYSIQRGQTELASFRLEDNASVSEARGRVWTDGELLWLERFVPGTARLRVSLNAPGYDTLELRDRDGRIWRQGLYVSPESPQEADGCWVRILDFQGLPPGLYTAVRRDRLLGQVEVRAEETALLEVRIDK